MTQWAPPTTGDTQQLLPPRPPRRRWPWIAACVALGVAAGAVVGVSVGSSSTRPAPAPVAVSETVGSPSQTPSPAQPSVSPGTQQVVYAVVSDTTLGSVSYSTGPGSSEQAIKQVPPWSITVAFKSSDVHYASVIAQAGPTARSVECRITVGSVVVAQHTSTGPSSVVTCANW